jgi:hypothetical protein
MLSRGERDDYVLMDTALVNTTRAFAAEGGKQPGNWDAFGGITRQVEEQLSGRMHVYSTTPHLRPPYAVTVMIDDGNGHDIVTR